MSMATALCPADTTDVHHLLCLQGASTVSTCMLLPRDAMLLLLLPLMLLLMVTMLSNMFPVGDIAGKETVAPQPSNKSNLTHHSTD